MMFKYCDRHEPPMLFRSFMVFVKLNLGMNYIRKFAIKTYKRTSDHYIFWFIDTFEAYSQLQQQVFGKGNESGFFLKIAILGPK